MKLAQVHPLDLHRVWDEVSIGLNEVAKHGATWRNEDVYHAVKSGLSMLFVTEGGFVVLTPQQDYDGVQLFIWACFAKMEEDPIATYLPELKEIAQGFNAKRIVFGSQRRWERKLAPYGCKPLTTYYGIDL